MEGIFSQAVVLQSQDCNEQGVMKLSSLLHESQEISGKHCNSLGFGWDVLQQKQLFWAVLRHKIQIDRLPRAGQRIILETWPMPTTRSAYPRAVRGLDEQGNILFQVVSLWVLMHTETRAMVLPGKSGITVPGLLRGDEGSMPGAVLPGNHENKKLWQVGPGDLDQNGHVNNGKYLDHVENLIPGICPREVTVCYLAEVLKNQEITLSWTVSDDGIFTLDGHRRRTTVSPDVERVFAVRMLF